MHYEEPTVSSSQKMKVKASSETPQLPEIRPHVSLHPVPIPEAARGEAHDENLPQIAGSTEDLSWFSFSASLSEPFDQPNLDYLASAEANNATNRPANKGKQPAQPAPFGSHSPERPSTPMSAFSFEVSPKSTRYYAQALSADDETALARGDKGHNLKEWSGKDLVTHHESRKALVPRIMPKVDKTNALAGIEHDKQHSQRALTKMAEKVRKVFRVPRITITHADKEKEEEPAWFPAEHWQLSSTDLRSSSVPVAPAPLSPPTPPFAVEEQPRTSHIRAASSGDYFSLQPPSRPRNRHSRRPPPLASSPGPSSGPPSDSSTRIRSPLAKEVQFRANPTTTFDSFLVPVKEGHKTKLVSPKGSPDESPKARGSGVNRLSKMPSMPLLRKRCSQRDSSEE
jgi:hypothetical protein